MGRPAFGTSPRRCRAAPSFPAGGQNAYHAVERDCIRIEFAGMATVSVSTHKQWYAILVALGNSSLYEPPNHPRYLLVFLEPFPPDCYLEGSWVNSRHELVRALRTKCILWFWPKGVPQIASVHVIQIDRP